MMRQKYKPTFSTQCTCCFREPKTCLGMKTVTVCHLQTWIQNFEIYVVISSFFKFDFWVLGFANFIFPKKDVSTIHSLWFANIAVPFIQTLLFHMWWGETLPRFIFSGEQVSVDFLYIERQNKTSSVFRKVLNL